MSGTLGLDRHLGRGEEKEEGDREQERRKKRARRE
jgi:hypothetical protein